MTTTRSLAIFILANVCLFMMISTSIAQFIIDTNGEPVEEGEKYFIWPAIIHSAGSLSLDLKNGSCPLNVVFDNPETVVLIPFVSHDEDDVRLNSDLRIQFIASTTCGQSTDWRLGERYATSGRRLIITGRDDGTVGSFGNFFRIVETGVATIYYIEWCPREVCPDCMLECGAVGIIHENGKTLLALTLDGGGIPVMFQKS
ncbi:Alpha-amylase/subtilisin inhibitor [Trifolium medium]|uniref:Alpha-amylase/subtilisin inhibitor n=1 Tax=Trifolium medium TaxID=97028 RepID=A0A392MYA9_9FABA|nr:Alpha-amylase/subtilisin inhibitor [Trifolium medium]